jgi:hypothetical protein
MSSHVRSETGSKHQPSLPQIVGISESAMLPIVIAGLVLIKSRHDNQTLKEMCHRANALPTPCRDNGQRRSTPQRSDPATLAPEYFP